MSEDELSPTARRAPTLLTRDAAEREGATILADEPEWSEQLEIVRVDFGGAGVRVERASSRRAA
jgi:hypothetical protein